MWAFGVVRLAASTSGVFDYLNDIFTHAAGEGLDQPLEAYAVHE